LGVVLVEAGVKSGALLTAQHALEQGREVFAVPGNINSKTSLGTNQIIKEGAKLVTDAEDILEELKFLISPQKSVINHRKLPDLSDKSKKLYQVLSEQPIHIDNIIKKTGFTVSHTLEILLELELEGLVKQLSGKTFVKQP